MANNKKSRFFTIFILLAASGFLLWRAAAEEVAYKQYHGQASYFLSRLTPAERVDDGGVIKGDPVYFTLRTLRPFDEAKLIIRYKAENVSVIEAGVLADRKLWRYNLKPVQNSLIDRLTNEWSAVRQDSLLLLDRYSNYSSVANFLDQPGSPKDTLLYNYQLPVDLLLEDYDYPEGRSSLEQGLRGAYQFFVYAKGGLDYEFNFSDLNINNDKDDIQVSVYMAGQLLQTLSLPDEGRQVEASSLVEKRPTFKLSLPELPEGAYKVEVRANDDIVTDKLSFSGRGPSFAGRIWLFGQAESDVRLYGQADEYRLQTTNPASLGAVGVSGNNIDVAATYSQYTVRSTGGIDELGLPGDIAVSSDGVLSFTKEALLNPEYRRASNKTDLTEVNYILADYFSPKQDGQWQVVELDFDLKAAYSEKEKSFFSGLSGPGRRYSFMISAPGLESEEGQNITIESIEVRLSGRSLIDKVINVVKNVSQ